MFKVNIVIKIIDNRPKVIKFTLKRLELLK